MRAAVVIHYSTTNYGNHLVNYATRRLLEQCGCQVDLVELAGRRERALVSALLRFPLKFVRLIITGQLINRVMSRMGGQMIHGAHQAGLPSEGRALAFEQFERTYLRVRREPASDRGRLSTEYDLFAVGSDQIWNYDYGLSPWHFLDFARPMQRICLSPSVGHDDIPLEWRPTYRRHLKTFAEVGTRELAWTRSVSTSRNTPPFRLLLDPTLMVRGDEWARLGSSTEERAGILVYQLGEPTAAQSAFVSDVARTHGLPVDELSHHAGGPAWDTNAAYFLGAIRDASCVVTDSYHGAIFAFLFNRPLIMLRRHGLAGSMNSRIETLATRLKIEDRFVENLSAADALRHDYSAGYAALETFRHEYIDYLARHGLVYHEDEGGLAPRETP